MAGEGTATCSACGAARPALARVCPYCNAEQRPAGVPDDATAIKEMLVALEERMRKAKKHGDGLLAVGLLVMVAAVVASWFGFRALGFGWLGAIASVIVTALGLVVAFGAWVGVMEARGVHRCYHASVKPTIDDFVRARGMTRHDFDAVASTVLQPDALLRPFLFGGDRDPG